MGKPPTQAQSLLSKMPNAQGSEHVGLFLRMLFAGPILVSRDQALPLLPVNCKLTCTEPFFTCKGIGDKDGDEEDDVDDEGVTDNRSTGSTLVNEGSLDKRAYPAAYFAKL